MQIKITLDNFAIMPVRAYRADAGLDLLTPIHVSINPGCRITVDTGVHVQIPAGYVGYVKSKSGLMRNLGIITDGTIDSGYTGSVGVTLINTGYSQVIFERSSKIAQLVIHPIELPDIVVVNHLEETERGSGGFGSTGR